jgi:hypothetical protein
MQQEVDRRGFHSETRYQSKCTDQSVALRGACWCSLSRDCVLLFGSGVLSFQDWRDSLAFCSAQSSRSRDSGPGGLSS